MTMREIGRGGVWAACVAAALATAGLVGPLAAEEDDFIPRRQDTLPGPPVAPEQARRNMTVPDGFAVELVASEPDVRNPVAMAIDERGRFWITESFEYPRNEPGPGRDRIRILEDTTGDGRADKATTFAEGLNIPSGIAVGYGGVWVANAPDILFMQDTTGDGRADHIETVVTGFVRDDTHELPNTLTWGPDGWLYGLHGVFNYSRIQQGDETFDFSAAVFRIHPITREFQVFAQGTSNPWGLAFDTDGSMFISACVIDHLWHITETGYYVRQAGTYPPFTWRIGSIVGHNHQMAAYCGLVYFDSDAYPEQYRGSLYMGNIHGGAINADALERRGSSYFATPRQDILQANDVWFMPVSQKVGPDGNLYLLDWYDRYHCYQDAQRDPEGVNRTHGRLWRLVHEDAEPERRPFPDMGRMSDEHLIEHLHSANVYHRETAQRLLAERLVAGDAAEATRATLEELVLDEAPGHAARMHALYAMVGSFELRPEFHEALLDHEVDPVRAWGVRAAGNFGDVEPALRRRVLAMADDPSPDVKLQVAIASPKLAGAGAVEPLARVVATAGDDELIPHIVWENLHPLLGDNAATFMDAVAGVDLREAPGLRRMMPRLIERVLAVDDIESEVIASLVRVLLDHELHDEARETLTALAERVRSGEVRGERLAAVRAHLEPVLEPILTAEPHGPMFIDAAATAAAWGHDSALAAMQRLARDANAAVANRLAAVDVLATAGADDLLDLADALLAAPEGVPGSLKRGVVRALGRLDSPRVGAAILAAWPTFSHTTRTTAVETLTQRAAWSVALLDAVADGTISRDELNWNQVRQIITSGDERVAERVEQTFGRVRAERDPARQRVIEEVHDRARRIPGDPANGLRVFQRTCAECHTIYGEGTDLGPDLTANGRGSFEQLVSNILDPNLIINTGYQLRTVITEDGRAVAGMIAEETDQRLVVQMIGGEREVIARDRAKDVITSPVSFMPEALEAAMTDQELIDLLAFLSLTRPPGDPEATLIPGAPVVSELDPERIHIPPTVPNLLVDAEWSSNIPDLDRGLRGEAGDMIWDAQRERFVTDSHWHEWGVGYEEDLGVVSEDEPVWWMAAWERPVRANLIVLSGTFPNQPQPDTAWRIELRRDGAWTLHEQGVGGWYDSGRYVWGGPGLPTIEFDAIRVSVFSKDDRTPIASIHFRGEPGVSWVVADAPENVTLEQD